MKMCPVFDNPAANRIAKIVTEQAKRELDQTPRHLLDPGNPNHPDNFYVNFFGYVQKSFMSKQYK